MNEQRTTGRIETIAAGIAKHLDGWQAVESRHGNGWWDLVPTAGHLAARGSEPHREYARLAIRRQYNDPGRITITGIGPDGWTRLPLREDTKSALLAKCTAAVDRDPAVIAREVQRKVLPAYLPALAAVVQRLAEDERAAQARREEADSLVGLFGGHQISGFSSPHASRSVVSLSSRMVGTVELNHDGSEWDVQLRSLPADLAKQIISLVYEHETAKPGASASVPPA